MRSLRRLTAVGEMVQSRARDGRGSAAPRSRTPCGPAAGRAAGAGSPVRPAGRGDKHRLRDALVRVDLPVLDGAGRGPRCGSAIAGLEIGDSQPDVVDAEPVPGNAVAGSSASEHEATVRALGPTMRDNPVEPRPEPARTSREPWRRCRTAAMGSVIIGGARTPIGKLLGGVQGPARHRPRRVRHRRRPGAVRGGRRAGRLRGDGPGARRRRRADPGPPGGGQGRDRRCPCRPSPSTRCACPA